VLYRVDALFDNNGAFLGVSPCKAFSGQTPSVVMFSKLDTPSPNPADTYQFNTAPAGQGHALSAAVTVPVVRYYYDSGSWWIQRYTNQGQPPEQMQAPIRIAHGVSVPLGEGGDFVGASQGPNQLPTAMSPIAVSDMAPGQASETQSRARPGGGGPLDGVLFGWVWYEAYNPDGSLAGCGWLLL
jgi:hypothetical protein